VDAAREKALGNACFGEKKFAEAIGHYGAALRAPGLAPRDPGRKQCAISHFQITRRLKGGQLFTSENASLERRAIFTSENAALERRAIAHFRERGA